MTRTFCLLVAISLLGSPLAVGQEGKGSGETTIVVDGLTHPSGIALQPETNVVFVADSGAGRIGRIADGKLEPVIEGSQVGKSAGRANQEAVGPLGLAFVDQQTLIVGDGGYGAGADCVRIFKLPEDDKTLAYEADAQTKLGPAPAEEGKPAVGFFMGLALAKHALYVMSDGDPENGWVLRSTLKGTKFGNLERVMGAKSESTAGFPTGIVISPRGEVVVALAGDTETAGNSQIAFFSARTNDLLLKLDTGLDDISAIAYSPKTGLLYATDFAWSKPEEGGLYRLDSDLSAGGQKLKATKIARLQRPAAMVIDKDGTAYIAVHGLADETSDKPAGAVLKVTGL